MSAESDTPRTDAFEYYFSNHDSCAGESIFTVQADSDVTFNKEFEGYSVPSNFARELKRELNAARADIAKVCEVFGAVNIVDLVATIQQMQRQRDEARRQMATEFSREEVEDQWTAAIEAAHPANDGADDSQVNTALDMVSRRHRKWSLVALVNWLLLEQKKTQQQRDEARAEILTMRDIFPAILKACGNGSECSPDASVEFLAHVPNEVGAVIRGLKQQRDRLAEALREFIGLDDDPPLSRHGKRWAEAWRKARAALAEVEGKEGV